MPIRTPFQAKQNDVAIGSAYKINFVTGISGSVNIVDTSQIDLNAPPGGTIQASYVQPVANLSTTSGTFVDISGITITLTTGNETVIAQLGMSVNTSTAGGVADVRLLVDGVAKAGTSAKPGGSSAASMTTLWAGALSSGSHTVKAQWRVSGGTLSCNVSSSSDTNHMCFILSEVNL